MKKNRIWIWIQWKRVKGALHSCHGNGLSFYFSVLLYHHLAIDFVWFFYFFFAISNMGPTWGPWYYVYLCYDIVTWREFWYEKTQLNLISFGWTHYGSIPLPLPFFVQCPITCASKLLLFALFLTPSPLSLYYVTQKKLLLCCLFRKAMVLWLWLWV